MKIITRRIQTAMGQITPWGEQLDYLTDSEKHEFDSIGYSGKKLDGTKTTYGAYLNSLGIGDFEVELLKSNNMEFTAEYMVIRVVQE